MGGKEQYFRIRIIFLLAIVTLLFLSILSYIKIKNLIDTSEWVNHTYLVKLKLENSISFLTKMESSERGYIVTKDSAFLPSYYAASASVNLNLHDLDSLTKDNPEEQRNSASLQTLIYKRIDYLKTTLAEAQISSAIPQGHLKQIFSIGNGIMEEVRAQVNKMQNEEEKLLQLRTESFTHLAFITPLFIIILFFGALIFIFGSYSRINDAVHLSQQLKAKLEASNIELEKKNEELVISSERYLKIFDNNPVAMTFDEIGTDKFVYANNLFYSSFGYTKEEVIGHTSLELNLVSKEEYERLVSIILSNLQESRTIEELQALPAEEAAQLLLKLKETSLGKGFEVLYTRKNGETFYAVVYYDVIDIGNKKYTLTSYQDISERKKVSIQLEEQNRTLVKVNKELESFNYISSHDLQEPLRQIQNFASRILALEQQSLSDQGKYYFEKINNAANRMQTLISDLLSYSRSKTSERIFENTSLNQIVKNVAEEFKELIDQKHATIEVGEMCIANIIPFQFRQLMYNLIGNSLKFSFPDIPPKIRIECRKIKYDKINNAPIPPEVDYYHISISDNGIGFEPQYKERIFEVFQRLHDKQKIAGTGIGLAIVKTIVENHNGIITATSQLNEGATFDIYIPVIQPL